MHDPVWASWMKRKLMRSLLIVGDTVTVGTKGFGAGGRSWAVAGCYEETRNIPMRIPRQIPINNDSAMKGIVFLTMRIHVQDKRLPAEGIKLWK